MKKSILLSAFITVYLLSCIVACNNIEKASDKGKKTNVTSLKIDTTKSFKLENYWVIPKDSIEFSSFHKLLGDTLKMAICAEFVFSPFGPIKKKSDIKESLLKNFNVTNRIDTMDIGPFEFQILKHNSSRLILFFDDDTEGQRHSNIFKGEVYDKDVVFYNGIRPGMNLNAFYKTFFDVFPDELKDKYKVIVIESCVQDITHTYTFKNKVLISAKFITDSYWKVDY